MSVEVISLNCLDDAKREIEMALERGDVFATLGSAQCLRAFCYCEEEFSACLGRVRALALQHRNKFSLEEISDLTLGLNEVEFLAREEGFLAVA